MLMLTLTVGALAPTALAGSRGVEPGVAPPPGLERAYASRRVALVVGIDRFTDPEVDDLSFAAKDAHDLAHALEDPEVGAYDVVSVAAGEVGRDAFWRAFRSLGSTVQRDDTVLVYVATHGTLDLGPGGAELFLLGSDGSLEDAPETGIRVEELADALSALPARRTVMILDACYAGTGRSVVPADVKQKLDHARGAVPAPPALVASALSAHLYSAHVHQPALEDPGLQNGVYTHFLIEALGGAADGDGDGLVEVMEAHHWARDRTLAHTGGSQVPWAETVVVGRQELYLAGDASRRAALEQALLDGLEALPDDAVVTVDGAVRGAGPLGVGVHRVEVRHDEAILATGIWRARPGRTLDVARWAGARSGRLELALGAVGALGGTWLGAGGGSLDVRVAPRDPSGARWMFGAAARGGVATPGERTFPAGTLTGLAWWAHPAGPLTVGPVLEAGLAWRLPDEPGAEGAPAVAPGFELRWGAGTAFGSVKASAVVFPSAGRAVVTPSLTVGLGARIR
jgi:hypothetical protein